MSNYQCIQMEGSQDFDFLGLWCPCFPIFRPLSISDMLRMVDWRLRTATSILGVRVTYYSLEEG